MFFSPVFVCLLCAHSVCRAFAAPFGKQSDPVDGSIKIPGFNHTEQFHFPCNDDYVLAGENVLKCSDGSWDYQAPRCLGNKWFRS